MRHLLDYKKFENKSILLNLKDNIDESNIIKITNLIPRGSSILEISCGNGSDSIKLSDIGYDVTSTEYNNDYVDHLNDKLRIIYHDTRDKFPFDDNGFDLIYSRLGLHYFSEEELDSIFSELCRMTNKYLFYTVKIVDDNLNTGKVIISPEIWKKITSKYFDIISFDIKKGNLYNEKSKWLEVVAKKY